MHDLPYLRIDLIGQLNRPFSIKFLRRLVEQPVDVVGSDTSVVLLDCQNSSRPAVGFAYAGILVETAMTTTGVDRRQTKIR